jgi:catechol 2,3-dioxygenase-like lactoylglutathione lyase family enzyme
VPTLRVKDARRSLALYRDQLGFAVDWEHQFEPGFPLFVSVSRDGVTLFLTEHPECAFGGLVYLRVEDVDALAAEFIGRGVALREPPADQPWRMREMSLRDPDDNELRFGQQL